MQSGGGGVDMLVFLLIIGAGLGVVITVFVLGRRRKANLGQQSWPNAYAQGPQASPNSDAGRGYGKRCPTCQSIYADETLAFCLSDGSTLELVPLASGLQATNATYAYPTADRSNVAPPVQYNPNSPPDGNG